MKIGKQQQTCRMANNTFAQCVLYWGTDNFSSFSFYKAAE
jgi:hypothetical protein